MTATNKETFGVVSRLGNCEVCAKESARYACPKCEVKTCSVSCVQIHKRELACDGVRDRTKYMPLSQMTEREFLSDYCFLEECTRYTEHRKQDPTKRYTYQRGQLPLPLQRMRTAAANRTTTLQFLLPHFTRHKENTTYLNWKSGCFFWRVEWLFTQNAGEIARFVDARCNETETLATLLLKYLDLEQATALEQRKLLQHHQSAGIGQITLWLRAEGIRSSNRRCYQLATYKTLCENLTGKTIVEFPVIFVSYEQHPPAGYDIIESDDETDAAEEVTVHVATKRNKQMPKSEEKRSKLDATAMDEELSEVHDVYELAARFARGNPGEKTDLSETSSDELPSEDDE